MILPAMSMIALPSAVVDLVGSATCRKPSPVGLSVIASPAPSPTRPSGTVIVPLLDTVPPISPTNAPLAPEIAPALLTAAEAPLPVKIRRPALKSALPMSSVEATKPPPTCTDPVGVIAMPLGLTRNTCPFALTWPAMVEVVVPVTRLRMAALEFGWTKLTLFPALTEKLFQSTIALEDVWLIVRVLPAGAPIVA
nr:MULTISPECIES: hypothetical protein [unclassified Bradyrhizobium]